MNLPTLHLGAAKTSVPLKACWVHFQTVGDQISEPFTLVVPRELWSEAFAPEDGLDPDAMVEFVRERLTEFGTFWADGVLRALVKAAREPRGTYSWVIASIDRVVGNSSSLLLEGRAIPFSARRA